MDKRATLTYAMSSSMKHKAAIQLIAITLHVFLLGIGLFASALQSSGDRDYSVRESRLAAPQNAIEGTALNRGVNRYDNQSPARFLALARFRASQAHRSTLLGVNHTERFYQHPAAGVLPIRSPPFQLPL